MGNCCATPNGAEKKKKKNPKNKKPNPFSIEYNKAPTPGYPQITVLKHPTGRDISSRYELGRELGRGEFGMSF
jgi:calcium-dependent protein kinase